MKDINQRNWALGILNNKIFKKGYQNQIINAGIEANPQEDI